MKASHPHNPSSITSRPTYSRKNARDALKYDNKEIRSGIGKLRERIEKHFVEKHVAHGDDEAKARELAALVCKECERAYEKTIARIEEMIKELYPNSEGEKNVEMDFSVADVQGAFRK